MKTFACGDVVPGCDARFVCDSEDSVLMEVARHAEADHGMAVVPTEVVEEVRSRIVEVA